MTAVRGLPLPRPGGDFGAGFLPRAYRFWSESDLEKLRALYKRGVKVRVIARMLGRSVGSVVSTARRHNMPHAYTRGGGKREDG